jgi:hypothetical protein
MHAIIDAAKDGALRFYDDLKAAMSAKHKVIDRLRVRVIVFRDYFFDGQAGMSTSRFFDLPDEKEAFETFLKGVRADGGGDEPESGLEALTLAIRSDWNTEGDRKRQVIVVWTDASAHPLERTRQSPPPGYPDDFPPDFNALTDLWEGQTMSYAAKRLILFAPDVSPWKEISDYWNNVIHYPSQAGAGLADVDYRAILDVIANSV